MVIKRQKEFKPKTYRNIFKTRSQRIRHRCKHIVDFLRLFLDVLSLYIAGT